MTFNHRIILKTVAVILLFEGIAMLIPLCCAIKYKETGPASAFFFISICCVAFGMTIYKFLKFYTLKIKRKEGYFITFLSWCIVCIVGALPYVFSECGYSFSDAMFESVAGWTTTGAIVIGLDTAPKSLILWNAVCNWLGGIGIIMLTISVFPVLGVEGQKMVAAEMPGPELEKFSARISETARISYRIYIILTVLELCLLLPSGLTPYEALVNTLSSISTAGIININNCLQLNFTPYIKVVLTLFSIIGSINYVIYFLLYNGKWRHALENMELRFYALILAVSSVFTGIVLKLSGTYDTFLESFGNAVTQCVSFASTSGFTVTDISVWPTACKMLLIILVIIGGCSCSSSGSLKVIRAVVGFKLIMRGIYKRIHPNAIKPIMLRKNPVSASTASSITVFIMMYFAFILLSCLIMSLENMDMETTLSSVLFSFSNNGTGFGSLTTGDYSIFSAPGKLYLCVVMLAGRLEMFAIILLFSHSFWNSERAIS